MVYVTKPPTPARDFIDIERGRISREIFVSEEIFKLELENLFARCWLFVGHESQISKPGDFFVSRMGNDSVLMTRDAAGRVNVLLNSCRHRGMKVCRYDEGNTMKFYCPYHGWTYSIDGELVSYPGELYGVPHFRTAYGGKLDKREWGLIPCPQVKSYKGMVFATWDPDAPSFEDYMGDFHFWIDNLADALDGTPGGAEVFRGVHKWRVKSNWKFAAENFLGDMYHAGPSHVSVEAVGIGPGGRDANRHGYTQEPKMAPETSFTLLGHGSCSSINNEQPYPFEAFGDGNPELRDYYKAAWEGALSQSTTARRPLGARDTGTLFPNMSFHSMALPRTILVAHPVSATETELWRWYIIDKDAPAAVREWARHYAMRFSGPGGLTEQDDMENWDYATNASLGTIARRYDYNFEMGIGMTRPVESLRDAVESTATPTEENARNFYRRWARMVDGEEWSSLMDPASLGGARASDLDS